MTSNAYIKLVPSSLKKTITMDELKGFFQYYKEITAKTASQVSWEYDQAAFPYEIKDNTDNNNNWFYLSSKQDNYHAILLGVDEETVVDEEGNESRQTYIQITLQDSSTSGDKGKANEFCKFLAKKLKGELHLFNGRIMYFYPRK